MKSQVFIGLILSCLVFSCKKQTVVCTGNCYNLNVNGKIVNALTNTNVSNVPLIIEQVKFLGLVSHSKIVQEFKSGTDGTFNTSPGIDTTMFHDRYFLSLKVKKNNEYISLPRPGDIRMYDLTNYSFEDVNISVYPKANLTIKLNRNQNDDFQYFSITYYFVDNQDFSALSILSPQSIHSNQLVVPTSADIFTKIRVIKRNSSGVTTSTLDSIKCLKNGTNIYTVNF